MSVYPWAHSLDHDSTLHVLLVTDSKLYFLDFSESPASKTVKTAKIFVLNIKTKRHVTFLKIINFRTIS